MECIESELRKCDPDYCFDLFENATVKTGNFTVTFMLAYVFHYNSSGAYD